MTDGGVAEHYRRAVEPAIRGVAGVVVTVAFSPPRRGGRARRGGDRQRLGGGRG
jgi:hypothetical protein